jgi:enoyl-[acyl-carrier protein] reductase III
MKDYLDFTGKRSLVTGGSRGIGACISRQLARQGSHVFINFREDNRSANATKRTIEESGGKASLVQANLLHPHEVREMFNRIASDGCLDILIHNAAIGSFKPVMDLRANQWDLTVSVNARALLLCAQEAAKLMEGRKGRIVSISSLGSKKFVPKYGAIGVSKAALESLTRYLAVEMAELNINVNAVSAGLIDTESVRLHPEFEEMASLTVDRTPGGRIGKPEDVADVVSFLCSPLADWIIGQTIVVDGGFSLSM